MKTAKQSRRVRLMTIISIVLAFVIAAVAPLQAAAAPVYPNAMAALGDSITRGVGSGFWLFDAPSYSWSTGTVSSVNSHYRRILAVNPAIYGKNYNYAKSGAKVSDLARQAGLVSASIQYVTVLIGANDVCTSSEATMTPVQTFHDQFQNAMNTLTTRAPNARIYVISIPDVYHLWELFKNNSTARSKWSQYQVCQSMLANPTSTNQADIDRRSRVRQRNIDFNSQLQMVCATFAQCRFDNNKAFNYQFATSDISTVDYFHPSRTGQATLARETWNVAVFEP
jgi:lysophospholipase L1-like esterase